MSTFPREPDRTESRESQRLHCYRSGIKSLIPDRSVGLRPRTVRLLQRQLGDPPDESPIRRVRPFLSACLLAADRLILLVATTAERAFAQMQGGIASWKRAASSSRSAYSWPSLSPHFF